ncbi:Apolipoprotein N-acyltransferase [Candidatus Methylobacter favarea]|uniref:Apolipoprotein N-acyltransferase n=1 Tax=Candidatus Methylobacter favarea TaxID=2707345 RepID=A0A8S0X175_9GAMM|nr:apolipoprotein N-acyltransferase [Candidatus Methylobacter favarea]CAA9891088.1 Apolipoprotein N-acyltransferase [Candidatus Methylobacter favarea]
MIRFLSDKARLWLLPLWSGILIGTSYIPFPPWASLFCFVPLWIFWRQQTSFKNVFLGGLITAFIFTLIGFNWVTYLLHEFAHLEWPIAILGMLLYALIAHLFVPIAGVLWLCGQTKFNWPDWLSLSFMALITTLCEAYSFTVFDWNFGYSWYGANMPIYQWAEIIGFSGLSAATLLCNLPLYLAWKKRKLKSGKILLVTVIISFMLLNVGGLWLKERLPEPDASFKTLLVQASIGNSEKIAAELGKGYPREILRRYTTLTDKALDSAGTRIDFTLWPETAFPELLGEEFRFNELPVALARFLRERQLALITGAYGVDERSRLITNSLFILDKNGEILPSHYSKTILLAFGEYIPGEQFFPELRKFLPPIGHFARGFGPTQLLNLNGYKMGPQICYESLFPGFSRSLADLGAQFIVNVTNDSWYGAWQEPYQHMYMTLARGVEFRRPVLRVTNTGISTVSLASGDILERSPIHQPWTGVYEVPYLTNPSATFYQRWFWLVPFLLWSALALLLGTGVLCKLKNQ